MSAKPTFTALLDSYLCAREALHRAEAKPGSGSGGDPCIGADPLEAERIRYNKASTALNAGVARLLDVEDRLQRLEMERPGRGGC